MAKLPTKTPRSANLLLQHIAERVQVGDRLPTEFEMAEIVVGSRTVVRRALEHFVERGLIDSLKLRYLKRKPNADDYFDVERLNSGAEILQQLLMERIFQPDQPSGTEFGVAELSRESGVSSVVVREFLIGFSRNGLIEKQPKGRWRLCALEMGYVEELAEAREVFELRAIERIGRLPRNAPAFGRLNQLLTRHEAMVSRMPASRTEFPALDREFHNFLISVLNNRFAEQLNQVSGIVLPYYEQHHRSPHDGIEATCLAIQEHLAILRALVARDVPAAIAAMRSHLHTTRCSMQDMVRSRRQPERQDWQRTAAVAQSA